MSRYLIARIEALPNVELHIGTEVVELEGTRAKLLALARAAAAENITVAIENHQDFGSRESSTPRQAATTGTAPTAKIPTLRRASSDSQATRRDDRRETRK